MFFFCCLSRVFLCGRFTFCPFSIYNLYSHFLGVCVGTRTYSTSEIKRSTHSHTFLRLKLRTILVLFHMNKLDVNWTCIMRIISDKKNTHVWVSAMFIFYSLDLLEDWLLKLSKRAKKKGWENKTGFVFLFFFSIVSSQIWICTIYVFKKSSHVNSLFNHDSNKYTYIIQYAILQIQNKKTICPIDTSQWNRKANFLRNYDQC